MTFVDFKADGQRWKKNPILPCPLQTDLSLESEHGRIDGKQIGDELTFRSRDTEGRSNVHGRIRKKNNTFNNDDNNDYYYQYNSFIEYFRCSNAEPGET